MTNDEFFKEIYERNYHKILRMCKYHLSSQIFNSEDCVQDIFLTTYTKLNLLVNHPNVDGWIMNTAKIHLKKYYKLLYEISKPDLPELPYEQDIIAGIVNKEILIGLNNQFLEYLGEDEYNLYKLFFFENLSAEEIAQELSISLDSARMRINRLRVKVVRIARMYLYRYDK